MLSQLDHVILSGSWGKEDSSSTSSSSKAWTEGAFEDFAYFTTKNKKNKALEILLKT